jgi:hypothetical protein
MIPAHQRFLQDISREKRGLNDATARRQFREELGQKTRKLVPPTIRIAHVA